MIGSAGMKRAVHIEGRIRAEQDAARVDEIEDGAGDGRAQQAVDGRDRAAGDAADHVVDGIGAREGGALAGENVEVAETMEQIGPQGGAQLRPDGEVRAAQRAGRTDAAVQDYLCVCLRPQDKRDKADQR